MRQENSFAIPHQTVARLVALGVAMALANTALPSGPVFAQMAATPIEHPVAEPGASARLSDQGVAETDSNTVSSQFAETAPCLNWLKKLDQRATDSRAEGQRWFLSEYDFDTRGYNVLHFMGHSPLPYGFSIWGFIDIEGADFVGANREDFATYFLEIDIKKSLWERGGLIGELNDLPGDANAIGRFGFYWKPEISNLVPRQGWLAGDARMGFKIFPLETDSRGWQASMNWNKKFDSILDGRFSAGGFLDLNFNAGPSENDLIIITEHQVRYRLVDGLHLITEFRLNEFLASDFGIAPGIQYRY